MKAHFLRMIAYNEWANQRVLDKLVQHPDQIESLGKLSHIALAEKVWLSRLEGNPQKMDIFQILSPEEVKSLLDEVRPKWQLALNKAEQSGFSSSLSYLSVKGDPFSNTLSDIFTHVLNHGTYHRAQIATLLRQQNLDPVVTDFIAFARAFPA